MSIYKVSDSNYECLHCGTRVSGNWQQCPNCATRNAIEDNTRAIKYANDHARWESEEIVNSLLAIRDAVRCETESSLPIEEAMIAGCNAALNYDAEDNPLILHLDGKYSANMPKSPYVSDRMSEAYKNSFFQQLSQEITSALGSIENLLVNIANEWGQKGMGIFPEKCFSQFVIQGERKIVIKTETYEPFLHLKRSADKKKWHVTRSVNPMFNIIFWSTYIESIERTLDARTNSEKDRRDIIIKKYKSYLRGQANDKWHSILVDSCKVCYFLLFPLIGYFFWNKDFLVHLFENIMLILLLTIFFFLSSGPVYSFLDSTNSRSD